MDRRTRWALVALSLAVLGTSAVAQFKRDPAEEAATEADHARAMRALGIASLRPGADGYNMSAPNAVNYDEARAEATAPPLPDPLRMADGTPVATASQWWKQRRPELVRLFDSQVYGRVPATAPAIRWEVVSTTREQREGRTVILRHLIGHAGEGTANPVAIELRVGLPEGASHVPLMLSFGFPEGFRFPGMPPLPPEQEPANQLVKRGWGYAVIVPNTIQADNGAGLAKGVIGLSLGGRPRGPEDWGVLRAWAWGASRALDWLAKDRGVDSRRVGIEGLSRYGKAAIVTMAYDPRFAIGLIGSSGAGGAKPMRRDFGERVENLAASGEYHWFCENFLRYAGPLHPSDLPVDGNELIALAAPRPVFLSAGNTKEDGWVDPRGTFEAAVSASPVWRLLGAHGLSQTNFPPITVGVLGGDLAYREHAAGHTDIPNWPTFLDWAARELQVPNGGRA